MKSGIKFLLFVIVLSGIILLIAKFTGIGSLLLYQYTNWDITGKAQLELREESMKKFEDLKQKVSKMPSTEISFDSEHFNFGKIKEGNIVGHVYKITNIGKNTLLIAHVQVGCGCTVASYTEKPIAPSKSGEIKIEFNTQGKKGPNHKNILVFANSPNMPKSISFEAEVY